MTPKIVVAFIKRTGHVLAAMTCNADLSLDAATETATRDDLPLRHLSKDNTLLQGSPPADLEFIIPKTAVAVGITDQSSVGEILKFPRTYFVVDPTKEVLTLDRLPTTTKVPIVDTPIPASAPDVGLRPPTLTANDLTIEVFFKDPNAKLKTATPVWALINVPQSDPQIVSKDIPTGDTKVTIHLQERLSNGDYEVLILVSSFPAIASKIHI